MKTQTQHWRIDYVTKANITGWTLVTALSIRDASSKFHAMNPTYVIANVRPMDKERDSRAINV